jgi:CheY-like chemotaxis protein
MAWVIREAREKTGGRLKQPSQQTGQNLVGERRPCAVVVDGDPEVTQTLSSCLSPELEVMLAASAVRATAVLEVVPRVDLAFLDLDLLGDHGEEILARVARWPDCIRVLLTKRAVHSEELPNNRHLAHLVLIKPPALWVVQALKRATLGLPKD